MGACGSKSSREAIADGATIADGANPWTRPTPTAPIVPIPAPRYGPDVLCHICCNHGGDVVIPACKLTNQCSGPRTICESCLRQHIAQAVSKQQYSSIECLCTSGKQCKVNLSYGHVKKYAANDVFRRYDEGLLREALEKDPEFCWCSYPGCGSGQLHVRRHAMPRMRCHACRHNTCFTHHCQWHHGRTCAQYDQDASASDEVGLLQLLERCEFRRCPSCNHGIEKKGGCSHMTCRCKHEFCWHCEAPYKGPKGIHSVGRKGHKKSCRRYGSS